MNCMSIQIKFLIGQQDKLLVGATTAVQLIIIKSKPD